MCFFCTFSFLRPFKADTIHLCFVLWMSGRSFIVHCAGCHPTFFFVFRRILSTLFRAPDVRPELRRSLCRMSSNFFLRFQTDTIHLVSCSGRQAGASSFIAPDVIQLFSSFSDGYYPSLLLHLSCILFHFPCFSYHFPSFFLPKFMQIFPFSLHIPFFCCTFAPSFVSVSSRRSPDGRPTVTRRSTDD